MIYVSIMLVRYDFISTFLFLMKDPSCLSGLFHHFSTSPVLVLLGSAFPTVASVDGGAMVGG